MSQLLAKIQPQQIAAGIFPDLLGDTSPLFVDAANVVFEGTRAQPAPGQQLIVSTGLNQKPLAIHSQFAFNADRYFIATAKGIWEWTGTALVKRWNEPMPKCQFASFGNFTVAADGGKLLLRKLENGNFERVADSPEHVDFVTVFSPFVLIITGDRILAWSTIDNPEIYTPDVDNQARDLPIRDMDGMPTCALAQAGGLYFLSLNGLWQVMFTGGTSFFGMKRLLSDIGAVGPQAAVLIGPSLYGVGTQGIWKTDGVSFNYIDTPILRDKFYSTLLAGDRISEIALWHDTVNERLVINFPDRTGAWRALTYSTKYQNWAFLSTGFPAIDRGKTKEQSALGSPRGNIYEQTGRIIQAGDINNTGLRFAASLEIETPYGFGGYGEFGYGGSRYGGQHSGLISGAGFLVTLLSGLQRFDYTALGETGDAVWVETKWMDFDSTGEKFLDEMVVKLANARSAGNLVLYIAYADRLNDEVVWSDPYSLSEVDATLWLDPPITARYFKIKIQDNFLNTKWQFIGLDFYGEAVEGRM